MGRIRLNDEQETINRPSVVL